MANSNGKITAPVRMIADVKTVLGESVNTLSGLCKSTKVNMWSSVKPGTLTFTKYTSLRTLCLAMFNTGYVDSMSGNGGYSGIAGYTPPSAGPYYLDGSNHYNRGFKGYNHNAAKPFQQWVLGTDDGKVYSYGTASNISAPAMWYYNSGAETLISSLGGVNLSGYYPAVAFLQKTGVDNGYSNIQTAMVTGASTWGSAVSDSSGNTCSSQDINISDVNATNGVYAFPVFSDAKRQDTYLSTSDITGNFYAMPLPYKALTYEKVTGTHQAYVEIQSATRNGSSSTVTFREHVKRINSSASATTTWSSTSVRYEVSVFVNGQSPPTVYYSDAGYYRYFNASSGGSWSGDVWTASSTTSVTVTLGSANDYIMVQAIPTSTYPLLGGSASYTLN